ncbi:MAG: hypothetical protein V4678_00385 [Patescibacteria group bacterium]
MAEAIIIGGFGSSPEQMHFLAERMTNHLGMDTIGINFREASQHKKRLASFVAGKTVVTHSGGLKPLANAVKAYNSMPERLTAIAPPVPEQIRKLLWRGAMIGLGLNGMPDFELERKVGAGDELTHHALANFGRIPSLSSFNAMNEVADLQRRGVETTIAFMEHDGLFDTSTESIACAVERVRQLGSRVVSIGGGHCRFTHDPLGTMSEIEQDDGFRDEGNWTREQTPQGVRHHLPTAMAGAL